MVKFRFLKMRFFGESIEDVRSGIGYWLGLGFSV